MFKFVIFLFCITAIANFGNAATTKPPSKCPQENCHAPLKEAFECLADACEDNEDQLRKRFDENESKLNSCFKDNKCSVPSGDVSKNDPDTPKKYRCVNAIIDKFIESVNKCVEKKLGVEIPEVSFNFTPRHQFHPQLICDVLNKSCDSYGDGEGVLKCANNLFENQNKTLREDFDKFCKADKQCVNKLSKGCNCQFWQIWTASEKCLDDVFKTMGNVHENVPECKDLPEKPLDPRCAPAVLAGLRSGLMNYRNRQVCGTFDNYQKEHFIYGAGGNDTAKEEYGDQ